MRAIIFFVLGLLVVFGLGAGLVYLMAKLFTNLQPGKKRVQKDFNKLRLSLPSEEELAPWSMEEMELLSLKQVNNTLKKNIITQAKGTLISIYFEPLVHYAYKKYVSPGEDAILIIKTSDREYNYRIGNKGVEITLNQRKMGILRPNGVVYNRYKRMVARFNKKEQELLSPILLLNPKSKELKEMGNLINPKLTEKVNPRALELVNQQMGREEEDIFLALALYELVKEKVR